MNRKTSTLVYRILTFSQAAPANKFKWLIVTFLMVVAIGTRAQEKNLAYYYDQAKLAYRDKDYPKFYDMIQQAHTLHPYHQGILYQCGLASALTGKKVEAISYLKKAILIDASFKLEGIQDFDGLKSMPEFKALVDLKNEWQTPLIHSDTAFVLKDRSLHTEGIAYDPGRDHFYVGSIHKRKIVRVTRSGESADFCPSGLEGMTSLFGLKVDTKRNILWACSSPMREMQDFDSTARSAVFKFELSSGKLLAKYQRPAWEKDGVFGDLVLGPDGEAIVSDSQNNILLVVNEKAGQLLPYFESPDFRNIQGLAFSDNNKFLYVSDYIKGVFRIDLQSRKALEVKCNVDVSLKGIDGLMYYDRGLVAIQNGVNPFRATRYTLNGEGSEITGFAIVDRGHPAFGEPTLGIIHDKTLYYIANSQWGGYDAQGNIKPDSQLQDIVILKSPLDRLEAKSSQKK